MNPKIALDHIKMYILGGEDDRALEVIQSIMFDPFEDVADFHRKMGLAYDGKPRALDFELLQFRLKFLREEMQEYEDHSDKALFEIDPNLLGDRDNANLVYHLAESLDSLVDLCYVALGTAYLQGFNFNEAWKRVHQKNMQKQKVETPSSPDGKFKLKVVKPVGWEPPRHEDLVEDHAHKDQG